MVILYITCAFAVCHTSLFCLSAIWPYMYVVHLKSNSLKQTSIVLWLDVANKLAYRLIR